jgi:uncharacterized protein YbjT (DUF2867 family)
MKLSHAVGMIGATGAVGSHVARALSAMPEVKRLTLIGRRPLEGLSGSRIEQHVADVLDPATYSAHLVSHEELERIDKRAALDFAVACKAAGVKHFSLLASVGANAKSSKHYLRTKGELEDGLRALRFQRLSLFHPSMILTPTNRYGLSQGILLAVWPIISPALIGPARKFRGIAVDQLGDAIARNLLRDKTGEEVLHWDEIVELARAPIVNP